MRMLAERLHGDYSVEVLTTCALEYQSWDNFYPQGESEVNGVRVRRFPVDKLRDMDKFKLLPVDPADPETEQTWIDEQGPYSPKLIEYIKDNKDFYDVFLFITYLYYHTVRGLEFVRDKAVLIPTAHDEPPIYFNIFYDIFHYPREFAFNTEEERDFLHTLFFNDYIHGDIIGVGIDIPDNPEPEIFKEKYNLTEYILYTGRIDDAKNCPELFTYFMEYKKRNPSELKLVLMGNEIIEIPAHPDILSLGFVSDTDRVNGMAGAKMFVLPSVFESLSMVVLESMAVGVPVVINGRCEVVKAHCLKSNAGLYYENYFEFEGCINYLLNNENVYKIMSDNARDYVEKNYRWDVILDKLKVLIERIPENKNI